MMLTKLIMEGDARVVVGSRWLIVAPNPDPSSTPGIHLYTVYERRSGAKNTTTVVETNDQHEAVRHLLAGVCEGC